MVEKQIIEELIALEAIKLSPNDPFTWTSGIKSPIYCDNRLTIGNVKLRKLIATELAKLTINKFPDVQLIGACATAGIPHGTSVADILNLDMIYFRSKPKEHGTNSSIEGKYTVGKKVVIIEDLISTGKSVRQATLDAQNAGLEVLGVVSIFTYGLTKATTSLAELGVKYFSLVTRDDLLKYANISEDEKNIVRTFLNSLDM